jgi:AcrR family transcriptional regulator
MTNPLLDSRSDRTRAALLGAFVALMFRDGFENISVQGIAAEAGMARSTFYEHFSGKDDVLRASMAHLLAPLADCVTGEDQPPEVQMVLGHMWENRRLADAVFTGASRKIVALSLCEMIEARFRQADACKSLILPLRLAAIQLAEAQLALVESWLRGRAFARAEDLAAALHRTSRASIVALRSSACGEPLSS